MNIILLKKRGEVIVKVKKLLVTYGGERQEPIDCQAVEIRFEGDTILLNIVLVEDAEAQHKAVQSDKPQVDEPQVTAVVPIAATDKFVLQGDDLEAFEMLSDFRREENTGQKTENDKLEAYTLESGVFDIQDLASVQNATMDIVAKEKVFIDSGYKVFKINIPRYDYENNNNFKLIESVVLLKPVGTVVDNVEDNK